MNRVESFFGMIGHDIKAIATWAANHQKQINATGEAVAAGVSLVDPPLGAAAAIIEQIGEKLFGKALAVLHDAGTVASSGQAAAADGGANLLLDARLIQDIKDAIKAIEALRPGTLATARAMAVVPVALPEVKK